jgi:hypothetical protein
MLYHTYALPDLRILSTLSLVPHEDYDPRRIEKLSRRILEEGILKNPPVVAQLIGDERFIVLDGANRVLAFAELKIPHIVVQLVRYSEPDVLLDTWFHVVSGIPLEELEANLTRIGDLKLVECDLEEARREIQSGEVVAYIVYENGVRKMVSAAGHLTVNVRLLYDIVAAYRGKADIYRGSNDIWEIQKPYYPDITSLVVFPKLQPAEIVSATLNGFRLPSGITRHIISGRALNINIPIGILMADMDIERKREWLHEWLLNRMSANAIRFYSESTISFNE